MNWIIEFVRERENNKECWEDPLVYPEVSSVFYSYVVEFET